ncbi:molecular chaperone DnaJ [Sporolactobacillus shoreae]|uniref:Molecular chaperone DnaJ n=1 Tax=Sporolactobacillus shoreae TaxID=1465501 RepID=A0A4Z0GPH3_9BACL|nr:molecular chaperone DnaJ [Sporolactobacillus shoreae]
MAFPENVLKEGACLFLRDILPRLLWGLVSAGVALIKRRNPFLWFIFGFTFVWASLIVIAILPVAGSRRIFPRMRVFNSHTDYHKRVSKTCPYCGSSVVIDDIPGSWICPECGRTFIYSGDGTVHSNSGDYLLPQVEWIVKLFAKLAKRDGVVTENEVRQVDRIIRQAFQPDREQLHQIMEIFNEARYSSETFEEIARNLAGTTGWQRDVLTDTLTALLSVAEADGVLRPEEEALVRRAAEIFGLDGVYETIKAEFFDRTRPEEVHTDLELCYRLLGCRQSDSNDEIKKTYRAQIKENHPDRLISHGASEEAIRQANIKVAEIKSAYDRIMAARG